MLCLSCLYAQEAAYQNGLSVTAPDARNMSAGQVPGFAGEPNPNFDTSSIGQAALQHQASSDVGQCITSLNQEQFTIHDTDPLVQGAGKAVANPHTTMEHIIIKEKSGNAVENIVTCEERGEEYVQTCEKHLEIDLEVKPETYKKQYYCNGHGGGSDRRESYSFGRGANYNPDRLPRWSSEGRPRLIYVYDRENYGSGRNETTYCNPGCQSRTVIDQPKSVKVTREEWVDGCQILESLADQGLCQCVDSEIGSQETRTINGEPITRDSWFEKYTYRCLKASADNCKALAAKGCLQVKSRCKEYIGNVCVLYEQTYRCKQGKRKGVSYRAVGDKKPFCLTGDCVDDGYEDNDELFAVLSQMTVLKQIQSEQAKIFIFSGYVRACRKHAIGFSDCCTTGGWGQSWGLAGCNTDEKELAEWRPLRRCVLVGTFCAEKLAGICLRKKTSYCCFGNKLSRLIQEQGRAQLGIGWGEPKAPDCRGFTIEELQRLDMSSMDLSELFADVADRFKPPSQDHIAKGVELDQIRANMEQIKNNLKKDADEEIVSPEEAKFAGRKKLTRRRKPS
jgi:hypothetical protein